MFDHLHFAFNALLLLTAVDVVVVETVVIVVVVRVRCFVLKTVFTSSLAFAVFYIRHIVQSCNKDLRLKPGTEKR